MTSNLEDVVTRCHRLATAAALPEVELGTSYGKPSLKVAGKQFVGNRGDGDASMPLPPDLKEMLLQVAPEIYHETDHYKGTTWLLIRMSAISDEELTQRLTDAWRFRAPKKLAASLRPTA